MFLRNTCTNKHPHTNTCTFTVDQIHDACHARWTWGKEKFISKAPIFELKKVQRIWTWNRPWVLSPNKVSKYLKTKETDLGVLGDKTGEIWTPLARRKAPRTPNTPTHTHNTYEAKYLELFASSSFSGKCVWFVDLLLVTGSWGNTQKIGANPN